MRDEDYVEIYNQSISGGTTADILERFEREGKARFADAFIFQSGGNDASRQGVADGPHKVPPDEFKKNITEIIHRAKKITNNILFIGFKNVDESRSTPVSWIDVFYFNKDLEQYDAIMKEVCAEHNVPYISAFGVLTNDDLIDGVHPNASGHQKIFEKVRDVLTERNWI